MSSKNYKILLKRGVSPGHKPESLEEGEININTTDKIFYYRPKDSQIIKEYSLEAMPDDLFRLFVDGFTVVHHWRS